MGCKFTNFSRIRFSARTYNNQTFVYLRLDERANCPVGLIIVEMAQEAENINKIREILFGNNLTAFEKRIEKSDLSTRETMQQLEAQFVRQLGDLRLELESLRNQQLEAFAREREETRLLISQFREELSLLNQKNDKAVSDFEAGLREYRLWMTEKSGNMQQEFLEQMTLLKNSLLENISALQKNKVDRNNLALLFSELAVQLGIDTTAEQQ